MYVIPEKGCKLLRTFFAIASCSSFSPHSSVLFVSIHQIFTVLNVIFMPSCLLQGLPPPLSPISRSDRFWGSSFIWWVCFIDKKTRFSMTSSLLSSAPLNYPLLNFLPLLGDSLFCASRSTALKSSFEEGGGGRTLSQIAFWNPSPLAWLPRSHLLNLLLVAFQTPCLSLRFWLMSWVGLGLLGFRGHKIQCLNNPVAIRPLNHCYPAPLGWNQKLRCYWGWKVVSSGGIPTPREQWCEALNIAPRWPYP